MTEKVMLEIDGPVATVRINRPEKQNALDLETFAALSAVGRRLAGERGVRAVVLSGSGEHFSAGIDLSVFGSDELKPELMLARDDSPANFFQHAAYVWRELRVPVICALKGNTFGGGLQVALGADIRIASADARLCVMEVVWGLIPDLGISTTAKGLVAPDVLKDLALTGRVVGAAEAQSLGLVTRLAEDADLAALETAQTIAGYSPDATQGIKQLLNEAWSRKNARALRLEASIQSKIMSKPNQAEAVQSRLEKRKPRFQDS